MSQGFIFLISDKSIANEWEHQVNLLSKWQMMYPAMKAQPLLGQVIDRVAGVQDPIAAV